MRRKREAALAIAKKKHHVIAVVIGERHIELSVPIEIPQKKFARPLGNMDWAARRKAKTPIALPEQHGKPTRTSNHQIQLSILIHVSQCDTPGRVANRYRRIRCSRKQTSLWLRVQIGAEGKRERRSKQHSAFDSPSR